MYDTLFFVWVVLDTHQNPQGRSIEMLSSFLRSVRRLSAVCAKLSPPKVSAAPRERKRRVRRRSH